MYHLVCQFHSYVEIVTKISIFVRSVIYFDWGFACSLFSVLFNRWFYLSYDFSFAHCLFFSPCNVPFIRWQLIFIGIGTNNSCFYFFVFNLLCYYIGSLFTVSRIEMDLLLIHLEIAWDLIPDRNQMKNSPTQVTS